MAQREITVYINDLTGKPIPDGAAETVRFALDGIDYEIDVDGDSARRLRKVFAPYVAAAHLSTRSGGKATRGRPARTKMAPDPSAVRAWAASHGIAVNSRGRIPASVVAQFEAAGH